MQGQDHRQRPSVREMREERLKKYVNGMIAYEAGEAVMVSLGRDGQANRDYKGIILSGPHKEAGVAGPFHRVLVEGLGELNITNRAIERATRREPWCPFCKQRHEGGDTCLGHHP
jgi:hypothetical protein